MNLSYVKKSRCSAQWAISGPIKFENPWLNLAWIFFFFFTFWSWTFTPLVTCPLSNSTRALQERSPSPGANPSTPQSVDSQPAVSETSTGPPHFTPGQAPAGTPKRRRGPTSAAEAAEWAQSLRRSTRNTSSGEREGGGGGGGSSSSTSPPPKRRLGDHHGTLPKFFLNLERSKCQQLHTTLTP